MKCQCGYETENKKSFSNHLRFGCPKSFRGSGKYCKHCNKEMPKKSHLNNGCFAIKFVMGIGEVKIIKVKKHLTTFMECVMKICCLEHRENIKNGDMKYLKEIILSVFCVEIKKVET